MPGPVRIKIAAPVSITLPPLSSLFISHNATHIASNLALHQNVSGCANAVNVALHSQLQVVARRLPVLQAVLDRMMRVRRHLMQHIVVAVTHGIVHTGIDGMRSRRVGRRRRVRCVGGGHEHVARLGLTLLLLGCGAHLALGGGSHEVVME